MCCCSESETGPHLPIEDGNADIGGETAELREPLPGRRRLPLLRAAVVAFHHLGGGHADRIEVKTTYARDAASIQRLDRRGLSCAGGTRYDQNVNSRHA